MNYETFLQEKVRLAPTLGFAPKLPINKKSKPFQRAIIDWAIRRGRAALFCDTGLGKTNMQLEWSKQIVAETGLPGLILAPLGVVSQTISESKKWGIKHVIANRGEIAPEPGQIHVSNYESMHKLNPEAYGSIVLDESSILKNFMGKTKQRLVDAFSRTPFRLCCTATPAPNDHMEIGNHCEFLGIMPSNEMLSRWFINDTMNFGNYRLKGHAIADFWEWVASWAIGCTKPSDLGDYDDTGYILPEIKIHRIDVPVDYSTGKEDGELFRSVTVSATSIHREMRLTCADRCARAAEIVDQEPNEPALIWCHTNQESDLLADLIPNSVVVEGSQSVETKEKNISAFLSGENPHLVTKPSICGSGLNFQHCRRAIFVGLSYSYEELYQAIRRIWRFGQTRPVDIYLVVAETEQNILKVIEEKQFEHEQMKTNMVSAQNKLRESEHLRLKTGFNHVIKKGEKWEMHNGDCCEVIKSIPDSSVDFCIHSPPFSNLYIYSASLRDMGNCQDDAQFFAHYNYLIPELLRVTKPGRLCAVHCKQLVKYQSRDGRSGLRDFRGDIIRAFESAGWQYHSEVCIWKDPVIEMQRTKAHGLLYKQLRADASFSRQGMAEYLCVFRKWGASDERNPVNHVNPEESDGPNPIPLDEWQQLASPHWDTSGEIHYPVWRTIRQTNVLNVKQARSNEDEKHICPLQLDVINRAVKLWTNPGDLVLSPFAGIGSEGFESIKMGRRFVGIELKEQYFADGCAYLESAERETPELAGL